MNEKCQKCGKVGEDRRTLVMECFYDMSELGLPFEPINMKWDKNTIRTFTLRVCKSCRTSWMKAIKEWFNAPIQSNETGSGIYVRELGINKEL